MTVPITAIDLFCGGGGFSTGFKAACDALGRECRLIAINHWERAIETHEHNHPAAQQHHAKVEELHPPAVVGDADVDLLIAGPECTHFSSARGGKPVKEQQRASPWHVVDWTQKVRPRSLIVENVPELASWGPIDEDGQPTRNGETFEAWINALCSLGYSVDWQVLNAANYGDATARKRLFVIGRRNRRATFPDPSHSKDGDQPGTEPWRSASEIIDWDDLGASIWDRSRPLVNNTMKRIAEGIRRHCHDELEPLANVVAELGKDDVEQLQTEIVQDDLEQAVAERDEPFLVNVPATTNAADHAGASYVLGQHGGSVARSVEEPLPTIATRGAIGLYCPETFVLPRNGAYRGLHSNATYAPESCPLHTITARNHDGHLVSAYLIDYYGNGGAQSLDNPLPTVTIRDKFALIVPDHLPWGLDIRFRMLKPTELAAAQGFPGGYRFAGNKTETTKQIGNAVPVHLAKSLVTEVLTGDEPSLRTYATAEEVPSDD